jgi:hypothetical protein
MLHVMIHRRTMTMLLAALCGCAGHRHATTQPTSRPTTMQISLTAHPPKAADPRDPAPPVEALIHLDIYQLDLPVGSVSRSEELWKRADEQCVGVGAGTADVLYKNGLRCGVVPRTEWAFFKDYMAGQPGRMRQTTINGVRGDSVALEMDKPIDREDLFYFDAANQLHARTFEQCVNGMSLSFQPAPRKAGSVRISICPTIRGERRRIEFTSTNQEYESPFAEVTRIYDLNLRADVPDDSFLIVAPSADANPTSTSSIGGRFFTAQEKSERLEQVLLIVPSFLRLDGKPITYTESVTRR